jgi:hypothetical protein
VKPLDIYIFEGSKIKGFPECRPAGARRGRILDKISMRHRVRSTKFNLTACCWVRAKKACFLLSMMQVRFSGVSDVSMGISDRATIAQALKD